MERLELRLRAEAAGCALTQQVHARCTATQRGWGGMSACEGERATGLGGRWWVEEGGETKGVEGEERKELNARRGRGHTTGEGHEVGTRRVQRFTRAGREREMQRERERGRGRGRGREGEGEEGRVQRVERKDDASSADSRASFFPHASTVRTFVCGLWNRGDKWYRETAALGEYRKCKQSAFTHGRVSTGCRGLTYPYAPFLSYNLTDLIRGARCSGLVMQMGKVQFRECKWKNVRSRALRVA